MTNSILGQRVSWYVVSYAHDYDFERARREGGSARYRVEKVNATRTGVVWSAGPVAGTAWIIPDERAADEGYAVCVQINPSGMHRARPADVERSTAYAQRAYMSTRISRVACRLPVEYLGGGAKDVRVKFAQTELAVA